MNLDTCLKNLFKNENKRFLYFNETSPDLTSEIKLQTDEPLIRLQDAQIDQSLNPKNGPRGVDFTQCTIQNARQAIEHDLLEMAKKIYPDSPRNQLVFKQSRLEAVEEFSKFFTGEHAEKIWAWMSNKGAVRVTLYHGYFVFYDKRGLEIPIETFGYGTEQDDQIVSSGVRYLNYDEKQEIERVRRANLPSNAKGTGIIPPEVIATTGPALAESANLPYGWKKIVQSANGEQYLLFRELHDADPKAKDETHKHPHPGISVFKLA